MGQVQVGAAIGASFRFIGEAWSKAWGIMLVLVWFNAALQIVELLRPTWTLVSFLGLVISIFVSTAATGRTYTGTRTWPAAASRPASAARR